MIKVKGDMVKPSLYTDSQRRDKKTGTTDMWLSMDLGYTTEYHNRRGYNRGRVKGTTAIITGNYVPLWQHRHCIRNVFYICHTSIRRYVWMKQWKRKGVKTTWLLVIDTGDVFR